MKMQHAIVAALIGLGAHAAFAASEGGDTWSSVAPRQYSGRSTAITVATIGKLPAHQADEPTGKGTPATQAGSDRIVQLNPAMRWVSVAYGERVTFNVADEYGTQRSFAWRFDVSPARSFVDLDDVAPADFPSHKVRVFVAEESNYRGG
jgi:Heavy-metal resistance protein CzcE